MAWKQIKDASMKVGYVGGWCLSYVQDAFGTDHPYPTALAEWNATTAFNHTDEPPLGITVPIFLSLGNVPAGHVAIRLSDGYVASSTQYGKHSAPYYHKNIADLVAVYGKYNGGATYLGWSEVVGTQRVVELVPDNATDDQIRAAYLEILERAADDGGLAHYRNYTIDFVRADLLNSQEYKTLLVNKAAQAKAAADAQAKADAKAKADAEAAAQAEADAKARQKAIDEQVAADAAAKNVQNIELENNKLLKEILSAVKAILAKLGFIK